MRQDMRGVRPHRGGFGSARRGPSLTSGGLCADALRLPASKIDALVADLAHQWRAVSVGASAVGASMDEDTHLLGHTRHDRHDPVYFLPMVGHAVEEHRHVVIRILPRI